MIFPVHPVLPDRLPRAQFLYAMVRFGFPVVPMVMAWLAIEMGRGNPRASVNWLCCASLGVLGFDWIAHQWCLVPLWWLKFRQYQTFSIVGSLALLVFSERMVLGTNLVRLSM